MSDCSSHSFDVRPIRGEIGWGGDMRPTPLSYARYVNGQERVAEYVELDGVRYASESERVNELESLVRDMWLYLSDEKTEFPGCIPVCDGMRKRMVALGLLE